MILLISCEVGFLKEYKIIVEKNKRIFVRVLREKRVNIKGWYRCCVCFVVVVELVRVLIVGGYVSLSIY